MTRTWALAAAGVALLFASTLGLGFWLRQPRVVPEVPLAAPGGRTVKLSSFRGKWLVVYFGYTGCPDACPTGLADLSAELKRLGPARDRVQVALVTLDPDHDRPDDLGNYVRYFDPAFTALVPGVDALGRLERHFGATHREVIEKGSRRIDHTLDFFLVNPRGVLKTRFLLPLPPGVLRRYLELPSR
jgi:protein SCO1/2